MSNKYQASAFQSKWSIGSVRCLVLTLLPFILFSLYLSTNFFKGEAKSYDLSERSKNVIILFPGCVFSKTPTCSVEPTAIDDLKYIIRSLQDNNLIPTILINETLTKSIRNKLEIEYKGRIIFGISSVVKLPNPQNYLYTIVYYHKDLNYFTWLTTFIRQIRFSTMTEVDTRYNNMLPKFQELEHTIRPAEIVAYVPTLGFATKENGKLKSVDPQDRLEYYRSLLILRGCDKVAFNLKRDQNFYLNAKELGAEIPEKEQQQIIYLPIQSFNNSQKNDFMSKSHRNLRKYNLFSKLSDIENEITTKYNKKMWSKMEELNVKNQFNEIRMNVINGKKKLKVSEGVQDIDFNQMKIKEEIKYQIEKEKKQEIDIEVNKELKKYYSMELENQNQISFYERKTILIIHDYERKKQKKDQTLEKIINYVQTLKPNLNLKKNVYLFTSQQCDLSLKQINCLNMDNHQKLREIIKTLQLIIETEETNLNNPTFNEMKLFLLSQGTPYVTNEKNRILLQLNETNTKDPFEKAIAIESGVQFCAVGDLECQFQQIKKLLTNKNYWEKLSSFYQKYLYKQYSKEQFNSQIRQFIKLSYHSYSWKLNVDLGPYPEPFLPHYDFNLLKNTKAFHDPNSKLSKLLNGQEFHAWKQKKEKLFIVMILHNVERLWSWMEMELLKFIEAIGNENCFISILSNGNSDGSEERFREFETRLNQHNIKNHINLDQKLSRKNYKVDRIQYLVNLRNRALGNVTEEYSKILYLNDVLFNVTDLLSLLLTPVDYDMVCAIDTCFRDWNFDYNHLSGNEQLKKTLFRDIWVAKDLSGDSFSTEYPFINSEESQNLLTKGLPFQVYSCWNGIVIFKTEPWLKEKIKFRTSYKEEECYASECELICKDFWSYGYNKIYINPIVQVAYEMRYHFNLLHSTYNQKIGQFMTPEIQRSQLQKPENQNPIQEIAPQNRICNTIFDNNFKAYWDDSIWTHIYNPLKIAIIGNFFQDNQITLINRDFSSFLNSKLKESTQLKIIPIDNGIESIFKLKFADKNQLKEFDQLIYYPSKDKIFDIGIYSSFDIDFDSFSQVSKYKILWMHYPFETLFKNWTQKINQFDQIWVNSHHLYSSWVKEGINPEKLKLVNGILSKEYVEISKNGKPLDSQQKQKTPNFLFMDDLNILSGIDIVLDAYKAQFTNDDKVSLTVASKKVNPEYQKILENWDNNKLPRLNWVKNVHKFNFNQKLNLYRSHSFLISPFRIKFEIQNILEAMATGMPIISPRYGLTSNLLNGDADLIIPSRKVICNEFPCRNFSIYYTDNKEFKYTKNEPTWLQINQFDLQNIMKTAIQKNPKDLMFFRNKIIQDIHFIYRNPQILKIIGSFINSQIIETYPISKHEKKLRKYFDAN
ncbi:hypothetical protein M0813_16701 [Anaeramoeba flamelloides]|uniref:Glycosyltransferase n=1 Tax=Anaeramoeba flamelloides TaxID=1746091 RepID=A0ABQ8YZV9_9EUKA|nr:hypothetical protein M0813_16701 [Anaeramoeba flamelloides]